MIDYIKGEKCIHHREQNTYSPSVTFIAVQALRLQLLKMTSIIRYQSHHSVMKCHWVLRFSSLGIEDIDTVKCIWCILPLLCHSAYVTMPICTINSWNILYSTILRPKPVNFQEMTHIHQENIRLDHIIGKETCPFYYFAANRLFVCDYSKWGAVIWESTAIIHLVQ